MSQVFYPDFLVERNFSKPQIPRAPSSSPKQHLDFTFYES
jgi:hypothetical protein